MSFRKAVNATAFARLGTYIMHRQATSEELRRLLEVAEKVYDRINQGRLEERGKVLASARETHTRLEALETIAASVARAICNMRLEGAGEEGKAASRWISSNVTAGEALVPRARAIWRDAAGLGFGTDSEVAAHTLKSAFAGANIDPIPQPEDSNTPAPTGETSTPSETGETTAPPETGKEKTMTDPTGIRSKILDKFAFNPAGLPKALRDAETQKVYLDAIVTAVALLGHGPDDSEEEALAWSTSTAALMLLDGRSNPQDSRFYAHIQKAVAELSSPVTEGAQIQIDGHRTLDGELLFEGSAAPDGSAPLMMNAPNRETQKISLFVKSAKIIGRNLQLNDEGEDRIFLQSWAVASRKAVDTYTDHEGATTPMTPTVDAAYASDVAAGGSGGGGGGVANVTLPPLNDPAGYNDEIVRENVQAVSTIYVSYQLEFAIKACARVLELFVAGLLPIPASDGSARELDRLYWDQEDLLDEAARRAIYARVLGAPGGELSFDIQPNTEFNTLLMRSVSAISEYEREQSALTHFDNAARGRRFQTTSGEFVRKAIRDFAANVSLRGWAGTAFTAERMAGQITRVMKVLNLPAVRNALGVTTPWQVIERISQREFGVTVNTVLHRTLAVETQKIMSIIADRHTVWSNATGGRPLFSETPANHGDLTFEESQALVIAAQHFRAVTGIGDGMMNEYSEPVETYAQPSLPDIGSIGGMGSMGGGGSPVNMEGIDALRNLVNSGQTPSPDQILSMLPRI